jgi:hypothetical protein|tara:strand:- start:1855 stop:2004 length:150 start_codon:yes stop_codon:yes gene_type:complete
VIRSIVADILFVGGLVFALACATHISWALGGIVLGVEWAVIGFIMGPRK